MPTLVRQRAHPATQRTVMKLATAFDITDDDKNNLRQSKCRLGEKLGVAGCRNERGRWISQQT